MADDEQDDASKTEDPSAKKLEEGRKRGQVAQSRDLSTWVMFLAATILIGTNTPYMFSGLAEYLRTFLEQAATMPQGPGGISAILSGVFFVGLKYCAIFFIAGLWAGR